MWRVAALTVRSPELTPDDFAVGWFDRLGQALAAASGRQGQARQLIANVRPRDLEPEIATVFPPRFDGLMEFWFDTRADAIACMSALSTDPATLEAADGLVDASKGVLWLAEVFPKKPETGETRVKFLAAGDAAEGWTIDAAQHYWSNTHPVVAQTAPKVWDPLTRYVQFHGREAPDLSVGGWLAVNRSVPLCSDMGFARPQDFLTNYTNDQYIAIVRPDEEKFSRPGADMLSFVSYEERSYL